MGISMLWGFPHGTVVKNLPAIAGNTENVGSILGVKKIPWRRELAPFQYSLTDFIFLGCKITADDDCSHEIKRCLLLGRKAMTNLDSILKVETLLCQQSQSYSFSNLNFAI